MKPNNLSLTECYALLSTARYGRLGLSFKDQPYLVPISYVYSNGKIYFHSREKGAKVEMASNNPRVCFEVDHLERNRWTSVIAYGKVLLSMDIEAKRRMFDAFELKGMEGHGCRQFNREELGALDMLIWELEIEKITGREGIW